MTFYLSFITIKFVGVSFIHAGKRVEFVSYIDNSLCSLTYIHTYIHTYIYINIQPQRSAHVGWVNALDRQ